MSEHNVLIIGAGVGGLILAQGLKRRGIPFTLFERDQSISSKSQGYRFRLVHEGLEALEKTVPPGTWELLEKTHPIGSPPDLMRLDARTGETTMAMKASGDTDRERRCYPIDRPWFRELLSIGIEEHIVFAKSFASYAFPDDEHVRVTFADGSTATGGLLVAADGVHSRVRRQTFPELKHLSLERTTIWGRTPLTPAFERRFGRPDVMANHFAYAADAETPARCCLFAPIRWPGDVAALSAGRLSPGADYLFWALNFENDVLDAAGVNASPEARARCALEATRDWHPDLRSIFEMQDERSLYAIDIVSSRPDVVGWETGPRLTFVGDAIHAMSPTGGSGGLAAVLDAADLCDALVGAGLDGGTSSASTLKAGLQAYEDRMRLRAKKFLDISFMGGKFLWAGKDWSEYSEV
jgi:2-polyprenyl-6-methoxyphenol hydroxylase-like FAD-dependent oxidoreductase